MVVILSIVLMFIICLVVVSCARINTINNKEQEDKEQEEYLKCLSGGNEMNKENDNVNHPKHYW